MRFRIDEFRCFDGLNAVIRAVAVALENIAAPLADKLDKAGHDVQRVADMNELGEGVDDTTIRLYAVREGRLIVASDDDFVRIAGRINSVLLVSVILFWVDELTFLQYCSLVVLDEFLLLSIPAFIQSLLIGYVSSQGAA